MKPNTQKNSLMTGLFVALLALSFGGQSGTFSLAMPSAYAQSNAQSPIVSANPDFHETICHFPQGNEINPQTIVVGEPAVLNAHLHHGDIYGACPLLCPPGAPSCVGPDGTPGLVWSGSGSYKRPSAHRELKGS